MEDVWQGYKQRNEMKMNQSTVERKRWHHVHGATENSIDTTYCLVHGPRGYQKHQIHNVKQYKRTLNSFVGTVDPK